MAEIDYSNVNSVEEALAIVNGNGYYLQFLPERYRDDKKIVLAAIAQGNPNVVSGISEDFRDDEDIAFVLVTKHGDLEHISPRLQDNKDMVSIAVKKDGTSLEHASQRLKEDFAIVKSAVSENGSALQYASYFQNDEEIVLAAVKNNGSALKFVSDFQKSKEIVLAAVSKNGSALQYASDFQNDEEIVLAAVTNKGSALKYIDTDLITTALAKKIVAGSPYQITNLPKEMRLDPDIIESANTGLFNKFVQSSGGNIRNGYSKIEIYEYKLADNKLVQKVKIEILCTAEELEQIRSNTTSNAEYIKAMHSLIASKTMSVLEPTTNVDTNLPKVLKPISVPDNNKFTKPIPIPNVKFNDTNLKVLGPDGNVYDESALKNWINHNIKLFNPHIKVFDVYNPNIANIQSIYIKDNNLMITTKYGYEKVHTFKKDEQIFFLNKLSLSNLSKENVIETVFNSNISTK